MKSGFLIICLACCMVLSKAQVTSPAPNLSEGHLSISGAKYGDVAVLGKNNVVTVVHAVPNYVLGWNAAGTPVAVPLPVTGVGPAGKNGNTIISGSGAPLATIGTVGDYYNDTTVFMLYGPKSAIGWKTPGFPLIGQPGLTGPAGPTGSTGPAGAVTQQLPQPVEGSMLGVVNGQWVPVPAGFNFDSFSFFGLTQYQQISNVIPKTGSYEISASATPTAVSAGGSVQVKYDWIDPSGQGKSYSFPAKTVVAVTNDPPQIIQCLVNTSIIVTITISGVTADVGGWTHAL